MANNYIDLPEEGGGGSGVSSLNGQTGALTLVAGTGIVITPSGSSILISSTSSGGTVTAVGLADSTGIFNISGSPVTTAGTLTLASLKSQTGNTFLAAPNGSAGAPTFRNIVAADVPTLNQNTTGTASNITATSNATLTTLSALSSVGTISTGVWNGTPIDIPHGGTGQTTANTAFAALSPMTTDYDLITRVAGVPVRFPVGVGTAALQSVAGVLTWTATPSPYSVTTINSNTNGISGTTYLVDTSAGPITLILPVPVSGAFVAIKDKTGSFQTNNLTVAQHATEQIEGLAASKILQTNWGSWSIFSDGTNWYMGPF